MISILYALTIILFQGFNQDLDWSCKTDLSYKSKTDVVICQDLYNLFGSYGTTITSPYQMTESYYNSDMVIIFWLITLLFALALLGSCIDACNQIPLK
jgi:hypothetical protein